EVLRNGTVNERLRAYARDSVQLMHRLVVELGGVDTVSEQQRLLIAGIGRLEMMIAVLTAWFLESGGNLAVASKISVLISQQRGSLQVLGLARLEHEIDVGASVVVLGAEQPAGTTQSEPAQP